MRDTDSLIQPFVAQWMASGVDDVRIAATTIAQSLELMGYETEIAYGPRPALESLARRIPDVILLDQGLPDEEGMSWLREMEAEGAAVVCEHTCVMGRALGLPVETEGDPLLGLARAYLEKPACPRAASASGEPDVLSSLAAACGADAVIYYAMKFCPSHVYGYGSAKRWAAAAGLPCLHLDGDGTGAAIGQARTRIQAFLEALS